jgi:hypothetical protein
MECDYIITIHLCQKKKKVITKCMIIKGVYCSCGVYPKTHLLVAVFFTMRHLIDPLAK